MEKTRLDEFDQAIEDLPLFKELKTKVIELLARREYSRKELEQKLILKAGNDQAFTVVEVLLDRMEEVGYLSDYRFATAFIRSKANSGYGPSRILQSLYQKGIDKTTFQQVLDEEVIDFYHLAFERMQRKYSVDDLSDFKSFQKCFRHMAGRGYTSDQINYAKRSILEALN